jgi:hypothetical protein
MKCAKNTAMTVGRAKTIIVNIISNGLPYYKMRHRFVSKLESSCVNAIAIPFMHIIY